MVVRIIEFIELVKKQLGSGYAWASQGELLTKELLEKWIKRHGRKRYYFSTYNAEKWLGKICYDCSGLIIWTLQQLGIFPKTEDYDADAIYRKLCSPLEKDELKPGDLCFIKKDGYMNHIGMYIGNNRLVHARGTNYGVVESSLSSSYNAFGRLLYFQNQSEKSWEQTMGEQAIDSLAKGNMINNAEYWKAQDLKNGTVPLWLFFEMGKRMNDKINKALEEMNKYQ